MIQLTLFIPLVIGGLAGAFWREHKRDKKYLILKPDQPELALPSFEQGSKANMSEKIAVVDDVAEIFHNQRVSLIALALSGSGALVFPPFAWASVPLLSYSTFYFINTIRRSSHQQKKSALTVFEIASVFGTLITGRYLLLSSLLALSFSTRKWALQAGNISSVGMSNAFDPNFRKAWVLRDGVEIEVGLSDLQENDIAALHDGDIIRMNGVVVEGKGIVRQIALTGALQVVPKQVGDPVFSYTKLVAGDLFVEYT